MASLAPPTSLPPEVCVSAEEAACLLDVARQAVMAAVCGAMELARGAAVEGIAGMPAPQPRRGAAFVTLLEDGELRGCIGTLDQSRPVTESVAGAAAAAARHDFRFRPVQEDELPSLEIEISVLGDLVVLEDPLSFRVGTDGLLIDRGVQRGLLLPEVATTAGFDALAMLEATCRKAGLPPHAWQDRGTTVRAFRTKRFGGPALASGCGPRSEEETPDQHEPDDHGHREDHELDG